MGDAADYLIEKMQHGRLPIGRVHPAGLRASPGSPLARARMMAHKAFDLKWESGGMTRNQAYRWLAAQMEMRKEEYHMLLMTEAQCLEVVRICTIDAFEDLT